MRLHRETSFEPHQHPPAYGQRADKPNGAVTIDLEQPAVTVGHHSLYPADRPEVLGHEQAAELLTVAEDALLELAARTQSQVKISGGAPSTRARSSAS